jgi:hypothetical protein
VFTPGIRRLICDAIESLILLLDEIDGDVDLEDDDPAEENGDAEPSLGAFGHVDQTNTWRTRDSGSGGQDLEFNNADREPSLGSLGGVEQTHWADGGSRDVEEDPAESGIGDWEVLMEQAPSWRHGGRNEAPAHHARPPPASPVARAGERR